MNEKKKIATLTGKICIEAELVLETGLHIGGGSQNSAIGAVDSPVIRNPITKEPIIPGSSLKGKMRTLLAKLQGEGPFLNRPDEDAIVVKRLFGSSEPIQPARLQFFDVPMLKNSVESIEKMNTDLYLTEVKFENSIDRLTSQANPRQIERVPAGAKFAFQLVYNVEDQAELNEDMQALKQAFTLLQMDYLGGNGSRGYGRVQLKNIKVTIPIQRASADIHLQEIEELLKGAE